MNEVPSATFRKTYAKLTEPTAVTVNGHPIGTWIPVHRLGDPFPDGEVVTAEALQHIGAEWKRGGRQAQRAQNEEVTKLPGGGIQARQSQRDELLRKINRGKR